MRVGVSISGLGARMAAARQERMRQEAVAAALAALAERARSSGAGARSPAVIDTIESSAPDQSSRS